jgi:hypothetical protein
MLEAKAPEAEALRVEAEAEALKILALPYHWSSYQNKGSLSTPRAFFPGSAGSGSILVEAEAETPKNLLLPLPLYLKAAARILVDFAN